MKVNPFKNPKLKAQPQRNCFPLSHTESFTAPFGALLPVSYYHLTAGSKFRVNMENQSIMTPVIRAPFARMFEHFEFFAVPMCQIQQSFDNFITGQSSYENSAIMSFNQSDDDERAGLGSTPNTVPCFTGSALESCFYDMKDKVDIFGLPADYNACRLLDLLGYGNYFTFVQQGMQDPATATLEQIKLRNLLPQNFYNLCAYQKIYYSHYCNTRYEAIQTQAFNIDDLQQAALDDTTIGLTRFEKMLALHYRWKSRDYFTSVQPSVLPSSSDVGFRSLTDNATIGSSWQLFGVPGTTVQTNSNFPKVVDRSSTIYNATGESVSFTNAGSDNTQFNVSSIRFAFAYDKLLRRMRVAGTDFNSQMLAQFGIAPSDARHGAAKYLGGYTNQLRFDEVTATANTDTAKLGNIAGKLSQYKNNSNIIEYTAKEDTIIMCIYSTSVDMQYHSFNLDRVNLRRYRFDWYNSVFENLGLQPEFSCEYSYIPEMTGLDDRDINIDTTANLKRILGYNKRYMEYKTKLNRVHGLMQIPYENPSEYPWVVQNHDLWFGSNGSSITLTHAPFNIQNLLHNPLSLNNIITVAYDGNWQYDHFKVFAYFNVKVIAPMSKDGEEF